MVEVRRFVAPTTAWELSSVKDLDVTRNFHGISSPGRYLSGLAAIPRTHASADSLYRGRDGLPETLRVGSKSGGWAVLYDKHRESPRLAPAGTLRFEIQGRGWCKRYGGITCVEDLTPLNIARLVVNRVKWLGLESELMASETACAQILRNENYDARFRNGLALYVLDTQRGVSPAITPRTASKYIKALRELGIAPTSKTGVDPVVTRLDFRSGTEVEVA